MRLHGRPPRGPPDPSGPPKGPSKPRGASNGSPPHVGFHSAPHGAGDMGQKEAAPPSPHPPAAGKGVWGGEVKDPRGGKGGVWGIKMAKKMEKNGKKCGVVCGGEGEDAGCHGNRRRERIRVAIAMGLIGRCCHSNRRGGVQALPWRQRRQQLAGRCHSNERMEPRPEVPHICPITLLCPPHCTPKPQILFFRPITAPYAPYRPPQNPTSAPRPSILPLLPHICNPAPYWRSTAATSQHRRRPLVRAAAQSPLPPPLPTWPRLALIQHGAQSGAARPHLKPRPSSRSEALIGGGAEMSALIGRGGGAG